MVRTLDKQHIHKTWAIQNATEAMYWLVSLFEFRRQDSRLAEGKDGNDATGPSHSGRRSPSASKKMEGNANTCQTNGDHPLSRKRAPRAILRPPAAGSLPSALSSLPEDHGHVSRTGNDCDTSKPGCRPVTMRKTATDAIPHIAVTLVDVWHRKHRACQGWSAIAQKQEIPGI